MKEITSLKSGISELQKRKNIIWLGAVSFEDRCTGSLEAIESAGIPVEKSILIEYPTKAMPKDADLKKRRKHRKKMTTCLKRLGSKKPISHTLHPYRLAAFNHLFSEFNESFDLVADISCFTKAHTISLALCIVKMLGKNLQTVTISYTRPKEYGSEYGSPSTYKMKHGRWPDIVYAPCSFETQLLSEEPNGVILLGHEGPRIALSLRESQPREAIVILANSPGEEHLQVVTRTVNARLLEESKRRGWSTVEIDHFDVAKVQKIVHQFTIKSVKQKRRLVLYPFGPKSLVFGAAFSALSYAQQKIWYCYPIPESYDVNYSLGIRKVEWFLIQQ
jgi:hypothetical protein